MLPPEHEEDYIIYKYILENKISQLKILLEGK